MATLTHAKLRNSETGLAVEIFLDGVLTKALAVRAEPNDLTSRHWRFDSVLFLAEGLLDNPAPGRQVANIWVVDQGQRQELIALYDSKFGPRWFVK